MSEVAYRTAVKHTQVLGHANRTAPAAVEPAISASMATGLADQFNTLDLFERLAAVRSQISGRIVFTTSFGLEAQALAHAIFSQALAIDVVTLDTGRLFPETHEVWAETERRYRDPGPCVRAGPWQRGGPDCQTGH
jgi:3'-phosphoadenosine 5'-phosphosulfate sulfotransferase (PAPS reductase)/FAD synthetase